MDQLIALVALRWRLDLRRLAWARERLVGLLVLLPFLLLGGMLGFLLFYFGVRALDLAHPELVLPLLSAAATGVGLLWALSPLLAGVALTEAHDVSRLVHFPVSPTTLAAASLVANLAQPSVLLKLPVLLGVALAVSRRGAAFPLVFAGLALAFVFMLVAAYLAGLLLHGVSRNRRYQDVALFVGLGLGFVLSVAPLIVIAAGGRTLDTLADLVTGSDVFAWSPFAWGVRAAVHAGRGEWLASSVYGVLAALAIGLAIALSAALVHRIHRGELDLGVAPGGATARARMLFDGALGSLVEKDLRSAWRDPALKATLLMGLVSPLLFLFLLSQGTGAGGSGTPVLLLASLVGLGTFGANAFGLERRGVQLLAMFPIPRWKLLLGKNLGAILLRIPGVLTLVLATALLAPVALLPAALVIALATFLVACGVDNYMAILFPVAAAAAGRNPYAGGVGGGRGLGAAMIGMLLMVAALVASGPFAFLAWLPLLLSAPGLWLVSLPLSLAGAASVYAMLVAGAARLLSRREPEMLQRILEEE